MSSLSASSVVPFRGENTCVISPLKLHSDRANYGGSRPDRLKWLYNRIEHEKFLTYPGGAIIVGHRSRDVVHNPDYWGGDGVWVTIPSTYNGKDLSRAMKEEYVVYDQNSQQHFVNGVEHRIKFDPESNYYGLEPVRPPSDQARSFDALAPK
ncbi:MAG: hypothetical protein DI551_10080 [Micavibrio aeruginosavorus]|uniref:Uncharacterized protein n=1 Tax=Micavibrio aeruginosavorus TaxID=349221 RepID=A0A2W5MT83_9BACT|nr:MAG: hypothetical protein DI551_10080 [Micavibrio aeruginosavorus]